MSSLRNAVARRPHRERAQPLERRRLGLLEKHKDYSLRARDFNKKKEQLKSLRQKAADRNEDEFYFGMLSRKGPGSRINNGKSWDGTVEGDRGNKSLSVEAVRLFKTQDMGYVRTMRQVIAKEVARLEEQVVLTRGLDHLDEEEEEEEEEDDKEGLAVRRKAKATAPRKIVFVDSEEDREAAAQGGRAAEPEGRSIEDGGENEDEDEDEDDDVDEDGAEVTRAKWLRRLKRQLENAKQKLKALGDAEVALDVQRAKMAKTATSGGYTRRGKKIMVRTRKR
ncbi:uncharacterized protein UV8b_01462 [Ustilaginoidea virens]|uniref:U3 small nucleolar RNA-associated protein 11 n=1 Tax=Ustilaginoidea virens TaxID=1159556 RepID=A0A063C2V2_USTVR|nr:uncharacterized protein UV8b_01462 [Ustilaginoidea virens]QUC17221.1 hypothetical protein UV8b_01462 [Ustilaginoidea virens]GAO16599.1 hypothetical protein UVI_02019630 [Ustilaginoidea virens]